MRLSDMVRVAGAAFLLAGVAACLLSSDGAQAVAGFIVGGAGVGLLFGAGGVAKAIRRL